MLSFFLPLAGCNEPVVEISDGKIQGCYVDGARRFLKIPYAKPPLGSLRWKSPQKNESWKGVRRENEFAAPCPQLGNPQNPGSTCEDCLYLNVWTPDPAPEKAPVMVWLHGGGNFAGSASDKLPVLGLSETLKPLLYGGQYFASRQGVIIVTVNYRLNVMGFFAHPGLVPEGSPRGNQGLLDQTMALMWVRDNIAAFGGDPGNVTLFGESAGASDVAFHVASQKSRGLFHRAVSESGGLIHPNGSNYPSPEDETAKIDRFANDLGCRDSNPINQLDCLRHVSVSDLLNVAGQTNPVTGTDADYSFGPVVDGQGGFFLDQPRVLFEQGDIAKVPYLIGSNTDEGTLFTLLDWPLTEKAYESELSRRYGIESLPSLLELYPAENFNRNYHAALSRVVGDQMLVSVTDDLARLAAQAGSDVFMYNFNIPWNITPSVLGLFPEMVANVILGATHSSEIGFVFGNPYNPSDSEQFVADTMNTFWATFARNGNPNFPGAPAVWPAFKPDADGNDLRMQMDKHWQILTNFRKKECAFWQSYFQSHSYQN
jgi:para-nitrobenzyl esterase